MRFQMILSAPLALLVATAAALPAQTPEPTQVQAEAQAPLVAPDAQLAEAAPATAALLADMGLYAILDVMAAEGLAAAADLEAEMFPGQGGSAWAAVVASIYAGDRMVQGFEAALPLDLLTPEVVAELGAYYDSDLGARIAAGELAARQSFLDAATEEGARDLVRQRAAEGHPRMALLTEFIAVNDLVELNVSGALNSNFAFYRGLSEGGAFASEVPETLMLAEVWGQEAEIRRDTTEWLFAYQMLAYEDLTDAEMQAYIDLTATPAGRALNAALFQGFAGLFDALGHDLGVAAAHFVAGEET